MCINVSQFGVTFNLINLS